MKKLGVGIIGLRCGVSHLDAFVKNPNTNVLGLCDIDRTKLGEISRQYQVKDYYSDYQDLIRRKDIDIIVVATPDGFHAEQAITSLKSGKHVIVEKPMAISLAECERMIRAVEKSGCKLIVNQILRFNPLYQLIKEKVDRNLLGDIFYVEADYRHNIIEEGLIVGRWRGEKKHNHTPFLGGGCHAIDLLLWIVGDVVEIYAYGNKKCTSKKNYPFPDCMVSLVKIKNGAIGKVLTVFGAKRPYFRNLIIYGTKASFENGKIFRSINANDRIEDISKINISGHPFNPMIEHFVDCIFEDKKPMIDVYEGARTVATALAGMESIERGKPVSPKTFK